MALLTLATSLALSHAPDDLRIYCLDFGTRALRPLSAFPHCAGIVDAADDPGRLLLDLETVVSERKSRLASAGAVDWTAYRDRHVDDRRSPYLLVLIDNYGGLAQVHAELADRLMTLLRDGPATGLHVVMSADRMGALPSRLTALFEGVLVMRQAEATDLSSLTGLQGAELPTRLPLGRGFWRTRRAWEVQLARADLLPPGTFNRL
jgi:S-DNA-T family DNA segregation ATPase FtsK/SpoIIIE